GLARTGPGRAGLGALFLHGVVKARDVDGASLLAQRILRKVEREAVGVIEPERLSARQRLSLAEPCQFLVKEPQAAVERLLEPRLLELQRLADQGLGAHELGICRTHLA